MKPVERCPHLAALGCTHCQENRGYCRSIRRPSGSKLDIEKVAPLGDRRIVGLFVKKVGVGVSRSLNRRA